VVVREEAQADVAWAYKNSARFREIYNKANANRNIIVLLSKERDGSSRVEIRASRGQTKWKNPPRINGQAGGYVGAIVSIGEYASKAKTGAVLGHELYHANELAEYGSIKRAPTARPSGSGSGSYETDNALQIEKEILAELEGKEGQVPTEDEAKEILRF
jgi:hypothetical protein